MTSSLLVPRGIIFFFYRTRFTRRLCSCCPNVGCRRSTLSTRDAFGHGDARVFVIVKTTVRAP